MTEKSLQLGTDFEARSEADWHRLLSEAKPPIVVETLQPKRFDQLDIKALYTQSDALDGRDLGRPGTLPFVRGASSERGWKIAQHYSNPLVSNCAQEIAEDLERGVEALWLEVGIHANTRLLALTNLDQLLEAVPLAEAAIHFEPHHDAIQIAACFAALAKQRGVELTALQGGFGCDPLAWFARDGFVHGGIKQHIARLVDLAHWSAGNAPKLRSVSVSALPYHDAGATEVQELSYAIATGAEYLRHMLQGELGVEQALAQIQFVFPIGGDFFTQIAKLRAARWCWSKVAQALEANPAASAMQIHARTSEFTKTQCDPWVNMLRATAECSAAALGGAGSIGVDAFDKRIGPSDPLARRVARNTQWVLREESYLGEVIDPAGGSWYIEALTEALARKAWQGFQAIEKAGGMSRALRQGVVREELLRTSTLRRDALAKRKTSIVGVNAFPALGEEVLERTPVPDAAIEAFMQETAKSLSPDLNVELLQKIYHLRTEGSTQGHLTEACIAALCEGFDIASVGAALKHGCPDLHIEPLSKWHAAEMWETLRRASDRYLAHHNQRPCVFLINLGSLASYKARATWAENLFAAGGIEAQGGEAHQTLEEAEQAWKESGTRVAVLCGVDAEYQSVVEAWVPSLKSSGCAFVALVGAPGEQELQYREAGVDMFVHAKENAYELLVKLHERLGVER